VFHVLGEMLAFFTGRNDIISGSCNAFVSSGGNIGTVFLLVESIVLLL